MNAVVYDKSVFRYLAARAVGRVWSGIHVSRFSMARLADAAPPPLPGPRWARIRPILSGVCGSDLATITAAGTTYFSPFTSTPFTFGHEVVGEVVETGTAVERVAAGDRVVLSPPLHCEVRGIDPVCGMCAADETGHCRNVLAGDLAAGIQTGYCADTGGGWSRSLVTHELQLHPVPRAASDEAAVLVEPFACCLHAVERSGLVVGETALVIGAGSIGLLTILAIRAAGPACRVVAVAKHPVQREHALRLGADRVVPPGPGLRERLAEELGASLHHPEIGPPSTIGGADVAFDCVGSSVTLDDAIRFTRARGTVVVVGMPGVPSGIDWTALWHKELDVRGSYTAGEETFSRAVGLVVERDDLLRPLVGATYPLEAWSDAVACGLDSGARGVIKVAFRP